MTVQEAVQADITYVGEPDIPVGMTIREYSLARGSGRGEARSARRSCRRAFARLVGRADAERS